MTNPADYPWEQYQIDVILEGLQFPEGAFWSERDNCLYFVEWMGDKIWALQDGQVELIANVPSGSGPCGLGQDHNGYLWATLYSAGKVIRLGPDGRTLQIIRYCDGKTLRGPNQLIFDSEGGLYFSASGDFEEDWRTGRPAGVVYYHRPGEEVIQLDSEVCFANGIALSPDGRKLFVNEHRKNRILQYDIQADGMVSDRRVFAELDDECLLPDDESHGLGPDGNCCDAQGNVWAAHYAGGKIVGFNAEGQPLAKIRLPEGRRPTNVAMTPDLRALYVTESEAGLLYRISFG